ncbi:MAG: DUF4320 family protein [Acetanaerobacterium sp.]
MKVLHRLAHKLRDRRGVSSYIAVLIGVLMLFTLLALSLETYGIYMTKKDCEEVATEIARYVEIKGAFDSRAQSEFDRLCDVAKLDAEIDVTKSGKIQLEQEFTVTVSTVEHLFTMQIDLQGRATGRSEVYHK